jgi:hypothetical protein
MFSSFGRHGGGRYGAILVPHATVNHELFLGSSACRCRYAFFNRQRLRAPAESNTAMKNAHMPEMTKLGDVGSNLLEGVDGLEVLLELSIGAFEAKPSKKEVGLRSTIKCSEPSPDSIMQEGIRLSLSCVSFLQCFRRPASLKDWRASD